MLVTKDMHTVPPIFYLKFVCTTQKVDRLNGQFGDNYIEFTIGIR